MTIHISAQLLLTLLLTSTAAAAQHWLIDYSRSTLQFQAVQQDAKFTGEFPEFRAKIELDPNAADLGLRIDATIDTGAVDTAYGERDEYLRSEAFFHAGQYPSATFQTTQARRVDNGVLTRGELTIKDVSHSIEMLFQYNPASQRLQGTGRISRLKFTVGTGMWEDTTWIADPVDVLVDIYFESPPTP